MDKEDPINENMGGLVIMDKEITKKKDLEKNQGDSSNSGQENDSDLSSYSYKNQGGKFLISKGAKNTLLHKYFKELAPEEAYPFSVEDTGFKRAEKWLKNSHGYSLEIKQHFFDIC